MGYQFLLQEIFLNQGSNSCFLSPALASGSLPLVSPGKPYFFLSSIQLCLTLGDPMDCNRPGFPVHHQLLELAQTHVHISQVGKSVVSPRAFAAVQELLWYSCSPLCGSSAWYLYGWANDDLLQKDLCHTPHLPGLPQPEPLSPQRATAGLWHSNTQRQILLSLCGVSGCCWAQGLVGALWASLAVMGFDSKYDFAPPTILLGLLLCPWMWGIFCWWDPIFSSRQLFSSEL